MSTKKQMCGNPKFLLFTIRLAPQSNNSSALMRWKKNNKDKKETWIMPFSHRISLRKSCQIITKRDQQEFIIRQKKKKVALSIGSRRMFETRLILKH